MELTNLANWLNLTVVTITLYIVIFYTLSPPKNECQMTFMMEPPRFIPIPMDDDSENSKGKPHQDSGHRSTSTSGYQLFMYNELGFPSSSNIHVDLKDSLPVLFIPGNAGSYQQVRSIASTSIRHQLQSLDAFKFIFYTIDFKGQLSGFSGDLIQAQTEFVHRALKRISSIHPDYVDGTILIGHSVGGFILKLLPTEPGFDPNSISIMISLAGPLTKPYLAFDDTMYHLYKRANTYWSRDDVERKTLSISVTGGRSDRLVPSKLCMDSSFDIAMTTGSIKDVWLTSDHVCITWCRELMQKLSHLMSKLMDKKKTQIISDKNLALNIMKEELLLGANVEPEVSRLSTWRTRRSYTLLESDHDFYSITRNQLLDNIVIVNVTTYQGLLIIIDHISATKSAGILGCGEVQFDVNSSRVTCSKKVDLMNLSRPIPTKRFETKKTVIQLHRNEGSFISNFIILTYNRDMQIQDRSKDSVPELVVLQRMDQVPIRQVWVPALVELLIKKLLPSSLFEKDISPASDMPIYFVRLELLGLDHPPLAVTFVTSCSSNRVPIGPYVQLYRKNYLGESFQPILTAESESSTLVTLENSNHFMIKQNLTAIHKDLSALNLYIDGRCRTRLSIDLPILDTVHDVIKNNLEDMLVCLMYLACLSIMKSAHLRGNGEEKRTTEFNLSSFISYTIVNFASSSGSVESLVKIENQIFKLLVLYTLTKGILMSLSFIMRRIIDLASILEYSQGLMRDYMRRSPEPVSQTNGSCRHPRLDRGKLSWINFEWVLIGIGMAGSTIGPTCLMSTIALFSIIKCGLSIDLHLCKFAEQKYAQNKHIKGVRSCQQGVKQRQLQVLNIDLAVLTGIVFLTNLPQAFVQLRSYEIYENMLPKSIGRASIKTAAVISTIMTKIANDKLLAGITKKVDVEINEKTKGANLWLSCNMCELNYMSLVKRVGLNMLVLLPMTLLRSNICLTNYILMVILVFVLERLKSIDKVTNVNKVKAGEH